MVKKPVEQFEVNENKEADLQVVSKNAAKTVYETKGLNLWYGEKHALKNIDLEFNQNVVTAIIGPSGCGISTYLKT
ncbi:MAG: phosphate ABC transporter ATP-binding protein, partial [Kurthia sp.]